MITWFMCVQLSMLAFCPFTFPCSSLFGVVHFLLQALIVSQIRSRRLLSQIRLFRFVCQSLLSFFIFVFCLHRFVGSQFLPRFACLFDFVDSFPSFLYWPGNVAMGLQSQLQCLRKVRTHPLKSCMCACVYSNFADSFVFRFVSFSIIC